MEFSGNEKRLNNDIVKDYYLIEISGFLLIFVFERPTRNMRLIF